MPFVGPGHGMALFLSTFVNKIDKKGRVSVPSAFRAALTSQGFPGVVLFPSFSLPAIEGWGMDRMEALSAGIDEDFDPLGNDLDEFANGLGKTFDPRWDFSPGGFCRPWCFLPNMGAGRFPRPPKGSQKERQGESPEIKTVPQGGRGIDGRLVHRRHPHPRHAD